MMILHFSNENTNEANTKELNVGAFRPEVILLTLISMVCSLLIYTLGLVEEKLFLFIWEIILGFISHAMAAQSTPRLYAFLISF